MSQSGSKQEIEIKLRAEDAATAERLILAAGFQIYVPRLFEGNTMYDTPERGLAQQGIVLRLRNAGSKSTMTVKGKSVGGKHKSREENEVIVSDFETSASILAKLGFVPVFRYEKYRTEYISSWADGTITLDETPIGNFLELEGTSEWIDSTAKSLNFREDQYIIDSYGRLYMEHCRQGGKRPSNMIFDI